MQNTQNKANCISDDTKADTSAESHVARTHVRTRARASERGAQCSGLFVLIWSGLGLRLTDLFSGEMSLFVPPVVNHHSVAVYNFCGLNPRHI